MWKQKNFNEIKEKINILSKELLDNLNDYIKEKDPDNVNDKYNHYIEINNTIISIIDNFFFNYQLIKDNPSIKLNISNIYFNKDFHKKDQKYLLKSSPDIYYKNTIKFFQEEFIISSSSLPEQLKHKFFKSQNNSVFCFFEISKNFFISNVKNNPNIFLYQSEKEKIKIFSYFKAHNDKVNWIIKIENNHIISCGNDGYLKIWPIMDENILKNGINNSNLEIKPIYEFDKEPEIIKEIQNMININNTSFFAFSSNKIFLFNYFINPNNTKIELIKYSQPFDFIDLILIKNQNSESSIAAYNKNELFIININTLEIDQIIKLNNIEEKNCLIQINNKEILISQKNNDLLVLDINNLSIKIKFNNGVSTDYLFCLKDGTFIQSGTKGMRRIMIKNFQEMPILYTPYNDTEFDHPYNVYEKITCLYEISDGNLIKCVVIGNIYYCEFIFI